jgi:hypothetical protein
MNQRNPTFNHASVDQKDEFHEATMAEKSDNITDNPTKHESSSASEYKSLEEYRAEVFGNKLRSARNK